jgi:hypothetical protein
MQTSSSRCNLCAMQPSLMDNNKMGVSQGEYNNQSAAVEAALNSGSWVDLGSVHNEVTTGRGRVAIDDGRGMGEGRGGAEGETSHSIAPQQTGGLTHRRPDTGGQSRWGWTSQGTGTVHALRCPTRCMQQLQGGNWGRCQ